MAGAGALGNAGLRFVGSNAQTITYTASNLFTGLVEVNKSAGTVTQASQLTLGGAGQDLTLANSIWDMAGFSLNVTDTLTLQSGTTLNQNSGGLSHGTLINNGTINP